LADISSYLKKILEAIYGEEVRGSIHDALAAMNQESSSAMEFAATAKDSAAASAEKAKSEAATAAQKAEEAKDSAKDAQTSEERAKASETQAGQYSDNAIDAASRAKESETNAADSAEAAIQKAREAEESRNAAALSASEAKAAEERIKNVKNEVETLGGQTAANAKAAQAAKEAAEKAKAAAKLSETNAKESETVALGAKDAAEAASGEAQAAKESAEDDALSAAQAKEDAENAKLAAEQAKTAAAESAGNAAESASRAEQYSGKPPKPQNGTWWIWDAETGTYYDTKISCELRGPIGVGIDDIQMTEGDHSPGSTDVYTVHLTDGSSYNISVYNGLNGTGAGDVLGISFDLVIPKNGWKDGSVTLADSRLLALATHKYFLSAEEACKEEFIDCNVQPKDITASGFLVFTCDTDPAMDLTVHLIRFELSGNGAIQ
jgi:hypothetical protein